MSNHYNSRRMTRSQKRRVLHPRIKNFRVVIPVKVELPDYAVVGDKGYSVIKSEISKNLMEKYPYSLRKFRITTTKGYRFEKNYERCTEMFVGKLVVSVTTKN